MKTTMLLAACLLVLASALRGALAHEHVPSAHKGGPLVISAAGGFYEVQKAFEKFQRELGGEDNGNDPGPLKDGFRSIDWDADIVPFDMPGDFFSATVTRGIDLVHTHEFRVSNPAKGDPGFPDNLFDSINKDHPNQFQSFSPERIFSPLDDNSFSILFSIPAKGDPANVAGYGAIFVDVDEERETFLEFLGTGAKNLGRYYVPAYPQGLSFLGVVYDTPVIRRVDVQLGNAKLPQTDLPPEYDVVVMDDFLFSEPQIIGHKQPAHATGRKEGSGYGYGR